MGFRVHAIKGSQHRRRSTYQETGGGEMDWINRLIRDEEGQGMVEYALILVFIALVVVGAAGALGDAVDNSINKVANDPAWL